MLYVTFAYEPDTAMLRMLHERLQQLDNDCQLYIVSDPKNPVPADAVPGAHHRTGTVDRGGNLNGLPIVAEELATFAALLEQTGQNNIVKIDADCYPVSLDALQHNPNDFVVCERWQPFTPAGMVYRLSRKAVNSLQREFNRRTEAGLWQENSQWPEDLTLWGMAVQCGLRCDLLPYMANFAAGMVDLPPSQLTAKLLSAHFIHCGEPDSRRHRVSREQAALRMRCLRERLWRADHPHTPDKPGEKKPRL